MEKLDDDWALNFVEGLDREALGNQGVDKSWKKMLLIGTEGSIGRERVHAHGSACLAAFLKEKLNLPMWFEVWCYVYTQSSMSFLKWLLMEMFRLACWCGNDGECSRMILDLSPFGDVDETKATFWNGEGATRCTVAVVG